jgi:hypothetical protein
MRAIDADGGTKTAESVDLEAEAAAWRRKRGGGSFVAGKIPVVRIRRREGLSPRMVVVAKPFAVTP